MRSRAASGTDHANEVSLRSSGRIADSVLESAAHSGGGRRADRPVLARRDEQHDTKDGRLAAGLLLG